MSNYILKAKLSLRGDNIHIDYNVIGSIVTFEEIEDKKVRQDFIDSFLRNDLIAPVDGEAKVVTTQPEPEEEAELVDEAESEEAEDSKEEEFEAEEEAEDTKEKPKAKRTGRRR